MRPTPYQKHSMWLTAAAMMVALSCGAQQKPKTEAEQDQFAGPVKTVVTTVMMEPQKAQDPPGFFTDFLRCQMCSYDRDGMWTQKGQLLDGVFSGEIGVIERDGSGRPLERKTYAQPQGLLQSRELFGPHGRTENFAFADSKLFAHQTTQYNGNGQVTEYASDDGNGKQTGRTIDRLDKDGVRIGQVTWKSEDELLAEDNYDPATDDERFTAYDDAGNAVLTWRLKHGELIHFWQAEGSGSRYGDNFYDDLGNGKMVMFNCADTGHCNQSSTQTEYVGSDHRNPKRVEKRNATSALLWAADYEYGMDAQQNWTSRKVWVWTPELGARTLYETDARAIEYWDR